MNDCLFGVIILIVSRHYFQWICLGWRWSSHVYIGANSCVVKNCVKAQPLPYSNNVANNISYSISQVPFLFSFLFTSVLKLHPYYNITSVIPPSLLTHSSFLPSGRSAPACGCPGRAPWLTRGHGRVSWQFPPSPGQIAAGIHPHSGPQPPAASDHSTPPGRSSSCVCVSWVTREIQKVRGR